MRTIIKTKAQRVFYNNVSDVLYKGVVAVYNGAIWLYNLDCPCGSLTTHFPAMLNNMAGLCAV